jgi:Kef-type K+ transport system membrane component KefB
MSQYSFATNLFPSLPLPMSGSVLFGVVLVAGLLGGHLFRRFLKVPITGFVVTGVLLGPIGLGLLTPALLGKMRIVVDICAGFILFELGRHVDVHWLRRERWLLATGGAESTLSFLFIYFTLTWFGIEPLHAAIGAAIGVCTSPAVLLMVSRDLCAEGQVTERALSLAAINSACALLLFTLSLSYLYLEHTANIYIAVLHPIYLLAGSLGLSWAMSVATLKLCRWLGRREEVQFILLAGMIVLTTGLASQFKLSVLLTLLFLGMMIRDRDRKWVMTAVEFGPAGKLCFVVLFVYAGATLMFSEFASVLGIAAAYIAARFAAKSLTVFALSRFSGLNARKSGLLCISLLPMSGFAVVMVQSAASLYPDFGTKLMGIVFAVVAILDLVGPFATQFSIKLAGEASPAVN